jgi:hypothetical protein
MLKSALVMLPIHAYQCGQKMKLIFLETTYFSGKYGLSGWSFGSRQNVNVWF